VIAATPEGSCRWCDVALGGNEAILLGSEAHGISTAWCDAASAGSLTLTTVALPMLGVADSLNVSATAAVLAYESLRQRQKID
jgi:TrmH family RNA methyltransferase